MNDLKRTERPAPFHFEEVSFRKFESADNDLAKVHRRDRDPKKDSDRDRDRDHHHGDDDDGDDDGGHGGNGGPPGPTATPFLVIPSFVGDAGKRPIPAAQAVNSQGIQATMTNPAAAGGWADFVVQLACNVADLGVVGCVAGLAEFYVGDLFSVWNPGHESLTAAQVKANAHLVGYAGFRVTPGGTTTVTCTKPWKPGSASAARKGVLVQVYDFFSDRVSAPFDAVSDRHVARNDQAISSVIISQGTATLKGTYQFDLDSGVESSPGVFLPSADIWWEQVTLGGGAGGTGFKATRQMTPQNGAGIINKGPVDFDGISGADLQGLAYTAAPINANNDATNLLVNGDVFAVKTSEANYSKVQVVAYGYDIVIRWVTYTPPP